MMPKRLSDERNHDISSAHCEPYSQSRLMVNPIYNLCESVHNKLNLYNNVQVIYLFDYTCIYINWDYMV
jgi:hypothetical protein